jgi:hypothetical protein
LAISRSGSATCAGPRTLGAELGTHALLGGDEIDELARVRDRILQRPVAEQHVDLARVLAERE